VRRHDQIFNTNADLLMEGIRELGVGTGRVDNETLDLLYDAGLVEESDDEPKLTDSGKQLFRAAWVLKETAAARSKLGQALRVVLPLQVIDQELRSFGAVPEDGVVNLLAHHGVVDTDLTADLARPTFRWLSTLGVIAYSQKLKTVRFIPDDPESAKAGEAPSLAAMISPRTPYSNLARLRRVLRSLRGVVTWADPHFGARAFEELADEIDPTQVTEIRIISGNADNVVTAKSYKDYKRFVEEMALKGVSVEWRVDNSRDWHDRFLVHQSGSYNVPPVNNLFQGQYSEILPSSEAPPVDEWWNRSTPRAS
jgi:hypothetical protein